VSVRRSLLLLVLIVAVPAAAGASGGAQGCCAASIWARDLPVGPARSLAGVAAARRFDLVGFHWRGSGTIRFRTRGLDGRWSGWQTADADDHVTPGGPEGGVARSWRLGEPVWTGQADRLEYRVTGRIRRLRAFYVWSPVERIPYRTVSLAGSPPIVPRSGWGANERILRGKPLYADAVKFAVVHHTATSNAYSPLESPAIVRGIELYHVQANGWKDIGYNFLVDRYGRVFEGRAGGIERNVIGAHAQGFNTGSVGVSVIGDFEHVAPPPAAQAALVKLLAWRLDAAHVDPTSTLSWISGGNPRFPEGVPVVLRAVSGHRDTGFTDCPGTAFYHLLDSIAARVAATGGPKLFDPDVEGAPGGVVGFTARLSAPLAWTVTVAAGHTVVARGHGTGRTVSWVWDATEADPGRYSWTIDAGPTVRPAAGSVGSGPPAVPAPTPTTHTPPPPPPTTTAPPPPTAPPPTTAPPTTTAPIVPAPTPVPAASDLAVTPAAVSPNGDGYADTSTVTYRLARRATVSVAVQDPSGASVYTLFSNRSQSAPQISFPLPADHLADGSYVLAVTATGADGGSSTVYAPFLVDRTLAGVTAQASLGTITFAFMLAKPAQTTITVSQTGVPLAVAFEGSLTAGPQSIGWDGRLPAGVLPPGHYDATVSVTDDVGTISQATSFDVAG